ncbi:MAG: hypothetical protein WCB21_10420, partial [Azonexus sp.]
RLTTRAIDGGLGISYLPFEPDDFSQSLRLLMAESSQNGAQVGRRKPAIQQCLNRKIPTMPPTAGHGREGE